MQQSKNMKALILHQYGKLPLLEQKPIPEPTTDQILVQVQASTINPSDKIFINGHYFISPLPTTPGFQGVGRVIKGPEKVIGKRVCFSGGSGSWAKYAATSVYIEIEEDVPVASAASGIVNPLTVLGFLDVYRRGGYQGIVHTAAASALGRQLNKICQTEKIPLLNIVRRQQQADLLTSQGAQHILITTGDWQPKYKALIAHHKFNLLFDALGGGDITTELITNLPLPATAYIYGLLAGEPLKVPSAGLFLSGLEIKGFLVFTWWKGLKEEERRKIQQGHSRQLKGDLGTRTCKGFGIGEITEALEYSGGHALEGKVLLRP